MLVTVVVSLFTKPKPLAELDGVVYGATKLPERRSGAFLQERVALDGACDRPLSGPQHLLLVRRLRMHSGHISIWFFIGVLLTVYGAMIFGEGVFELVTGHLPNVVLANLHAPVWWGALAVGSRHFL